MRGMVAKYSQKNPFDRRNIKTCWICQKRPADSQEHSFKASRIRDMLTDGGPLHVPVDGVIHQVRGPKSKTVKFGKTMCQKCNNELTKPFDDAYDYFIDFIKENFNYFRDRDEYQWSEIYAGMGLSQQDLERYYLKNVGCRIVDAGAPVPEEIRTYLFNYEQMPTHSLLFYRNYEIDEAFRILARIGGSEPTNFMSPFAHIGTIGLDGRDYAPGDRLGGFAAAIQDGPVGVLFQWYDPSLETIRPLSFGIQPNFFVRDRDMFKGPVRELLNTWDDYSCTVFLHQDIVKSVVEIVVIIEQMQQSNLYSYKTVSLRHMLSSKLERLNKLIAEFDEVYPRMLKLTGHY